jgi:Undecaprenyl-phosphate galactose phosphotransferase WbaP
MQKAIHSSLTRKIPVILCLMATDSLCLFVSFCFGYYTRNFILPGHLVVFPEPLRPLSTYLAVWWWILPVFLLILSNEGTYSKRRLFWLELFYLYRAVAIVIFILFMAATLTHQIGYLSRLTVILTGCFMIFLFPLTRVIMKYLLFSFGSFKRRLMVIGTGASGAAIAEFLRMNRYLGYEIAGFLDDDPALKGEAINGIPILGTPDDLQAFCQSGLFDETLIAKPGLEWTKLMAIYRHCEGYSDEVKIMPDLYGIASIGSEIDAFNENLVISSKISLNNGWNIFIKRLFDLLFASLAFIVFLPLFLTLMAVISLEGGGSAFYTEKRVGRNGRPFTFIKFRTMYSDGEKRLKDYLDRSPEAREELETYDKLRNDPRVTRVGRLLRRTSLDETPQLLNVIRGDMSLVGPRPLPPEKIDRLDDAAELILRARPGITGFWQASGRSGVSIETRLEMDIFYVRNWSLWLDFIILMKTIRVVLLQEGAF